jgi:hypothetical protein
MLHAYLHRTVSWPLTVTTEIACQVVPTCVPDQRIQLQTDVVWSGCPRSLAAV